MRHVENSACRAKRRPLFGGDVPETMETRDSMRNQRHSENLKEPYNDSQCLEEFDRNQVERVFCCSASCSAILGGVEPLVRKRGAS
jgi:hypothetical protein